MTHDLYIADIDKLGPCANGNQHKNYPQQKIGAIDKGTVHEKYLFRHQYIDKICLLFRGGRVCLDNLKQFLSGKLLCLMPLPVSVVV
jgi:hypothetical protein